MLLAWCSTGGDDALVEAAAASTAASGFGAGSSGSTAWVAAADSRTPLANAMAQAASMTTPRPAAAQVVSITAMAPPRLRVGETHELVVAVGSNAGIGEIGFTVQFDPDVLQVRAGTEGDWAAHAGVEARFAVEISSAEDRVHIRTHLAGRASGGAGGSVALVQFQAVAPGATSVMVSDVTVSDRAGNALPFTLSPSSLPVTATSLPPSRPPTAAHEAPQADANAIEAVDIGD